MAYELCNAKVTIQSLVYFLNKNDREPYNFENTIHGCQFVSNTLRNVLLSIFYFLYGQPILHIKYLTYSYVKKGVQSIDLSCW